MIDLRNAIVYESSSFEMFSVHTKAQIRRFFFSISPVRGAFSKSSVDVLTVEDCSQPVFLRTRKKKKKTAKRARSTRGRGSGFLSEARYLSRSSFRAKANPSFCTTGVQVARDSICAFNVRI